MGDVVEWPGITRLDMPVEKVLEKAKEANLSEIVVVGYDQEGMFFASSSKADGPNVLWLLRQCEHELFKVVDALVEGDDPETA